MSSTGRPMSMASPASRCLRVMVPLYGAVSWALARAASAWPTRARASSRRRLSMVRVSGRVPSCTRVSRAWAPLRAAAAWACAILVWSQSLAASTPSLCSLSWRCQSSSVLPSRATAALYCSSASMISCFLKPARASARVASDTRTSARAAASCASSSLDSKRASNWPRCTTSPSLARISSSLPGNLALRVEWWRASMMP